MVVYWLFVLIRILVVQINVQIYLHVSTLINMKLKATTAIILDTRREKKDKTYPVKIRVTYDQKYKKYGTKYTLNESDYKTITSNNFRS